MTICFDANMRDTRVWDRKESNGRGSLTDSMVGDACPQASMLGVATCGRMGASVPTLGQLVNPPG
jgi:hypothetical protein